MYRRAWIGETFGSLFGREREERERERERGERISYSCDFFNCCKGGVYIAVLRLLEVREQRQKRALPSIYDYNVCCCTMHMNFLVLFPRIFINIFIDVFAFTVFVFCAAL